MKINNQKGFIAQGIATLIALILIGGGIYYTTTNKTETFDDDHTLVQSADLYTKYATTTETTITVISPNGGENFVVDGGDINASIPVNFKLNKPQGFSVYLIDSKQNVTASWATDNRFNSDLKINYKFNLNSLISGEKKSSPTKVGEYKIKVCDYYGNNCDISDNYFTIINSPKIIPDALSDAEKNVFYTEVLEAKGFATSTLNWKIINGSLPPGLHLQKAYITCLPSGIDECPNSDIVMFKAMISGKPTKEGEYDFTIETSNGTQSATREYNIIIKN